MRPADLLEIARKAALAAGPLLLERFGTEKALATKSSLTDVVSQADLLAEEAIRAVLRTEVPDDTIVGEEGDDVLGTTARRWLIDPIDGTVNYLYGNPQWCISVACAGIAGVVYDPVRDELFAADAEGTATLNGDALTAADPESLGQTLVATGFGYEAAVREQQVAITARLLPRVRDIRRGGSAALDLAWVAAGRMDAYFEYGIKEWDVAAGSLICERAGLKTTTLQSNGALAAGLLVAPPRIFAELHEIVS
jgi:myo-inositol-1(or 4)-monophosphatase